METDYLKEYIAVADSLDFFETAEQFYISQSTLYRHIKVIEESLGLNVPLFVRTNQGMHLNRFGEIFLEYAKKMVAVEEECIRDLKDEIEADKEVLNIATIEINGYPWISDIISGFCERNPFCEIHLIQADSETNVSALRGHNCDFVFELLPPEELPEYEKLVLHKDRMVAIVPRYSALAEKEHLSLTEIGEFPLLMESAGNSVNKLLTYAFSEAGVKPRVAFTSYNRDVLKMLAQRKMGVALLSCKETDHAETEYTLVKKIHPPVNIDLVLLYRANALTKPVNQAFLSWVQEYMAGRPEEQLYSKP